MGIPPGGETTFLDLKRQLERMGVCVKGVQFDPRRPRAVTQPMILHLARNHFVTVLSVDEQRWVLVDPPKAPIVVDPSVGLKQWDGAALVITACQPGEDR